MLMYGHCHCTAGTKFYVYFTGVDTPASRSILCCGDKLLAVNGESLMSTVHSQVTELLHKVIICVCLTQMQVHFVL